jgi:hypothetical protein
METNTLPNIIRQYVHLGKPNSQGWQAVACKVCGDHTRKGLRAGFKLSDHAVGYNCYNCGHKAVYDPSKNRNPSKNMITILEAFGIPESEWQKVSLDALLNKYESESTTRTKIDPATISPLPFFYRLVDDPEDDWCQYSIEYLNSRGVDWTSYPFYCVRKMDHPDNKKWYGRLIVPIYKNNNLIFYQGRDLTDLHVKKYLSATTPRDNVLFGYDQLLVYNQDPLYIVEGWFDAYALNGIAVFCNSMTPQQIQWINRSNRPKVVIPDRMGDGHLLAQQAIELDWHVSCLDINDNSKDVNESIIKHGFLFTMNTIINNTSTNKSMAKCIVNSYCKGSK